MSVCVDGSNCFQSYGWGRFRHLGSLTLFLQFVERHQIDELLFVNPQAQPVFEQPNAIDLALLSKQYVPVPLTVAGGLESDHVFRQHCKYGLAERFMFTGAILRHDSRWLDGYATQFGRQSIIGCLPVSKDKTGRWVASDGLAEQPVTQSMIDFAIETCDEVLVQQIEHYGCPDMFDFSFEDEFLLDPGITILNGGIGPSTFKLAGSKSYAAAYVDNSGYHSEFRL